MTDLSAKWSQLAEAAPSKVLSRIIINTMPVDIVGNVLLLIYVGDIENKEVFNKYYTIEKFRLLNYVSKTFSIDHLKPLNSINQAELEWIINYSKEFGATKISWNF